MSVLLSALLGGCASNAASPSVFSSGSEKPVDSATSDSAANDVGLRDSAAVDDSISVPETTDMSAGGSSNGSVVTSAPETSASKTAPPNEVKAAAQVPAPSDLFDESGAPLPQTEDKPSVESAHFQSSARALFDAIVADDVELAMPFFFPKVAYEQVKHIVDPGRDWETRLVAAYKKDIHKYHQALGKFRTEATFQEVRVTEGLAKWVKPGVEVNKVGYHRVMRSVLVYRDQAQRSRELGIITMISWRGEWYVVHLAPFK